LSKILVPEKLEVGLVEAEFLIPETVQDKTSYPLSNETNVADKVCPITEHEISLIFTMGLQAICDEDCGGFI
jgi:hypothetical protein